MARKLKLFIWEEIANIDWTGGDLIISAYTLPEAIEIAVEMGYEREALRDWLGGNGDTQPLIWDVAGFRYEGPGGG